jgi:negative regulator of genetic competence, sporulation and motility
MPLKFSLGGALIQVIAQPDQIMVLITKDKKNKEAGFKFKGSLFCIVIIKS